MSVKGRRQELIRKLIAAEPVVSQERLVSELVARGEEVTQATVSRDLRELGVLKGPEGYRLPEAGVTVPGSGAESVELARACREYLLEAVPAATIAVLKTGAGQASAMALRLDRSGWADIVGTVAGDDTVFAAARTPQDAKRIAEVLMRIRRGEQVSG